MHSLPRRTSFFAPALVLLAWAVSGCARGYLAPDDAAADAPRTDGGGGDVPRFGFDVGRFDALPGRDVVQRDAVPQDTAGDPCAERAAGMVCRLVGPQCGCAAGEACAVDLSSGQRLCAPPGALGAGLECTGPGTCGPGLECTGALGGGGLCREYCDPAAGATCGTARLCAQLQDGAQQPIPGAGVCLGGCNPRTGGGCMAAGYACRLTSLTGPAGTPVYLGECGRAGTGAHRAPCTDSSNCLAGHECFPYQNPDGTPAGSLCTRLCRVGVSTDCAAAGTDRTCSGFTDHPTVDGVEYGACGP